MGTTHEAERTCSECGDDCSGAPVADLCGACLAKWVEQDPIAPLDAEGMVHLNLGSGKGRWVRIADLLAEESPDGA